MKKFAEAFYYGNFFVSLCVVALCIETNVQLELPLNNTFFYIAVFASSILFYTIAYLPEASARTTNKRSYWYAQHKKLMFANQYFWLFILLLASAYSFINYYSFLIKLPLWQYAAAATFPLIGLLYYGKPVLPGMQLNLRNSGWLKPFFIGFVWAGIVSFYPLLFFEVQHKTSYALSFFNLWFLVKNWMFITVLCIMFDIKDYAADYNHRIKTFVVRTGLRYTIFRIIIPLAVAGFLSYIVFVVLNHFPLLRILVSSIPFILLIAVARSLRRRKSILYYLAIIDGLMLIKAACGVLGVLLTR